jgi:hypothetical protein
MLVYMDICCLKRPFDDQSQPRIHLETEAVLALLDAAGQETQLLHAAAQDLENDQNPLPSRAARVRQQLETIPLTDLADDLLQARTAELMALGFKNFDAFHLASAEQGRVEALVTCDARLLATAKRHAASLNVRVVSPIDLVGELFS